MAPFPSCGPERCNIYTPTFFYFTLFAKKRIETVIMFQRSILCLIVFGFLAFSHVVTGAEETTTPPLPPIFPGVPVTQSSSAQEDSSAGSSAVEEFLSVCDRTAEVREAILEQLKETDCAAISEVSLQDVIRLNLERKNIATLKVNDFSGLSSLTLLNLSDNLLMALPVGVFSDLDSLRWLYLYNNELASLPVGVFNGLASLQILDLEFNNFSPKEKNRIEGEAKKVIIDHHSSKVRL